MHQPLGHVGMFLYALNHTQIPFVGFSGDLAFTLILACGLSNMDHGDQKAKFRSKRTFRRGAAFV